MGKHKHEKTLISIISFIIAILLIAAIYGFFDEVPYYIVGLLIYLPIFLIPTIIYEENENSKISYLLIVLLWIVSFLFTYLYLSVQGMGAPAGTHVSTTEGSMSENIKGFLIVSFPYFVYVITFLTQYKLWKEILWGCIGYVLLFISAAFI